MCGDIFWALIIFGLPVYIVVGFPLLVLIINVVDRESQTRVFAIVTGIVELAAIIWYMSLSSPDRVGVVIVAWVLVAAGVALVALLAMLGVAIS